jgi:hypothetical protein
VEAGGPYSATVGTFGSCAMRSLLVTAMARRRPSWIRERPEARLLQPNCTTPAAMSATAGALPRQGMSTV